MLNRAHCEPVVPVVVVLRINTTTVEVQVPRITGRIERSGPVVTVRTTVVPRRSIAVAGASKKLSVISFYEHLKESTWKPGDVFTFSKPIMAGRMTYEYRSEPSSYFIKIMRKFVYASPVKYRKLVWAKYLPWATK